MSWPIGSVLANEDAKDLANSVASDFEAKGIDGNTYHLQELLEQGPVYLDFWTTWCKPCLKELPKLQELYEKYRDRGFTLITVASDDPRTVSKVKPLAKSRKWEFPIILDSKRQIGNKYNVRKYPTAYMIAPTGQIVSATVGYRPGDEKKIEEELLKLLPDDSADEAEVEADTGDAGGEK